MAIHLFLAGQEIHGQVNNVLWNLSNLVKKINKFIFEMDRNIQVMEDEGSPYDGTKYVQNARQVAGLYTQVEEWRNLEVVSKQFFADDTYVGVSGITDYGAAIVEISNYGMAITKAMIDRAEMTQDAAAKRATLDIRINQNEKTKITLEALKKNVGSRFLLMGQTKEQAKEIETEVNHLLMSFCQAFWFYYEQKCPTKLQPVYGASLDDLLVRLSDASIYEAKSKGNSQIKTFAKTIIIEDKDLDENCTDVTMCPVNYLKKFRSFQYEVGLHKLHLKCISIVTSMPMCIFLAT